MPWQDTVLPGPVRTLAFLGESEWGGRMKPE